MKLFDLFALMPCHFYAQAWNTILYKQDFSTTALLNNLSSKHEESKTDNNTGLFISLSRTSELDCATTKKDTAERSI